MEHYLPFLLFSKHRSRKKHVIFIDWFIARQEPNQICIPDNVGWHAEASEAGICGDHLDPEHPVCVHLVEYSDALLVRFLSDGRNSSEIKGTVYNYLLHPSFWSASLQQFSKVR